MLRSLLLGLLTSGSLLVGALAALRFKISHKAVGFVVAFGVGALISSVCFELVSEAFEESSGIAPVVAGLLTGALVYFIGDLLIDNLGGHNRKSMSSSGREDDIGPSILLGTVLDGIPESLVIGMSAASGAGVSAAMIAAVFLSNIPEALTSTTGLLASGWRKRTVVCLWLIVIAMSALAAMTGYLAFAGVSGGIKAFILTFAGGAILTMLTDTMIPEAYRDSGKATGLIAVLGFCFSFAVTTLE